MSADGGTPEPLTDFPGWEIFPDWSPDGLAIAFDSEGPHGVRPQKNLDRITGQRWHALERPGSTDRVPMQQGRLGSRRCEPGVRRGGREWARVSRDGEVLSRYDPSAAGLQSVFRPKFSPDGSRIYLLGRHEDGSEGVWWIPAHGGEATKVVALDAPSVTVFGFLTVGPENLNLTITEYESDIWVMDLEY